MSGAALTEIVEHASRITGWMREGELRWLAKQASERRRIVEVGSWKGRSTKALAMATPGTVYAVDNWLESPPSPLAQNRPEFDEISRRGSEAVYQEFCENLRGELNASKLVVVRAESAKAVETVLNLLGGPTADMVFIDADHAYDAVKRDILAWRPVLAPGGILSGHDYHRGWQGVIQAVSELVPTNRRHETIWWAIT